MYLIDMFYFVARKLPVKYEPLTPVSFEKPLDFAFVLDVQRGLIDMAQQGTTAVPDEIAAATREIHHRAIAQFDSLYARSFVEGFNRISRHIDMGMYDACYIMGTQSRLTHRLADDLGKGEFLAEQRIRSVQAAFKSMGTEFAGEHKDRVVDALYDRFDTEIRIGSGNLASEAEKLETVTGLIDHCVKNPLTGLRMI